MDKFKASIKNVRKAIAAAIAVAVVAVARKAGVEVGSEDVQTIVDGLIILAAVYFAPSNVKPYVEDVVGGE